MLCTDDAGIVSKSAERLVKMMTVSVTVFEADGFAVSETEPETMLLRTPDQPTLASSFVIGAAGQGYIHTA